ncbi:choice-of-anchor U domain-containing protein [Paraglaciecola sp. L3A3]|uniref:choice-of-anchor U domain-containing protein n=1 Tax=Paraglaciecola sp. L3A3 TaxID=2686358 RepID=UPI00131E4FB0|nr:choice-of-anchor U domain-containing protein [Paraglaciecola sp. L3A3]
MKTKFPFKYNKVAALLLLSPLGMAHAALPYFLESSTGGTDFELLFTTHDSASSSMLLDIDNSNNVHLGFTSDIDSVPRYTKYEDGVVTSQALDVGSNAANGYPTVLVNPAIENGLVTVYNQGGVVKVATSTDNGASWTTSANTMSTSIVTDIDAAQELRRIQASIDSQGKVYVAYTTTTASVLGKFHINSYDTTTDTWADETQTVLDTRDVNTANYERTDSTADIVISADDKPYAVYRASNHFSYVYTPDADGVWQSYKLHNGDRVMRAENAKIAIDNDGTIYILYSGNESWMWNTYIYKVSALNDTSGIAEGGILAEKLLDKLTVTPNIQNTAGNTDVIPNLEVQSLSRPVFDNNNNMFFAFSDPSVTDTKDFIVAKVDTETGDATRLNNNYVGVTGLDAPSAGFNTVDLAIDGNDLPVVVFNEGTPTVMRLARIPSGESLAYTINDAQLLSVGSLTGRDTDGDVITYTITDDLTGEAAGSAAALFTVDSDTDQLMLKAPAEENNTVYNLTVTATANSESTSVDIAVTVEFLSDRDGDRVTDIHDVFPDDPTEWADRDEDGYGDNSDPTPDDPNDVTGPTIMFNVAEGEDNPVLVLNATGFTSELTPAILADFVNANITASDFREGATSVGFALGTNTQLVSGVNTIQLTSTDSAGNEETLPFFITVYVNPVVQVATNLVVETDGILSVPINLKGTAPAYPVVLNYTVTPSNTGITSAPLTASFDEGDITVINYDLSSVPVEERTQTGESISIEITDAINASVPAGTTSTAQVISGNVAPVVTLSVSQLNDAGTYENVSLVAGNAGNAVVEVVDGIETVVREAYAPLVKVTANIYDVNMSDTHCVTFTSMDGALVEYVDPNEVIDPEAEPVAGCNLSNTFIFDPSNLPNNLLGTGNSFLTGKFNLEVSVVENHSVAPFTTEKSIVIDVNGIQSSLIPDTNENGVPDYAESDTTINDSTILGIVADEAPLQVSAGLSLSLGGIAHENRFTSGLAAIDAGELEADLHYTAISDIIDFKVNGLQQVGDPVSVVVPLTGSTVIPEGAVYRKYTDINGWFNFVEDANNMLKSAMKDDSGNCPIPNSASYTQGLTENDNCIQLTIEDGGLNDGDGLANGTIVDPGVLVTQTVNTPPVVTVSTHAVNSGDTFTLLAHIEDAENDDITVIWEQVTGPNAEVIDASTGQFTAPVVTEPTDLTFMVTVNDGQDTVVSEEFTVKVTIENLKPEYEIERKVGSFGWFMLALGGLFAIRRKRK